MSEFRKNRKIFSAEKKRIEGGEVIQNLKERVVKRENIQCSVCCSLIIISPSDIF